MVGVARPHRENMLNRILSHDLPRSRWLAAALILIVIALALAPWLFPGSKALGVAAKMLVFILLVASYDLLLGYTGIVSFAHTMFFGIGAYGVAIASTRLGEGLTAVLVGAPTATAQEPQTATRRPDVIYVPTPEEVVDAMLTVAKVTSRKRSVR